MVIGAGPIGAEIPQAYARFGAQATLIDERLLSKEEPEVAEVLGRVFAREGIRFVPGHWAGGSASARPDRRDLELEGAQVVSSTPPERQGSPASPLSPPSRP
jgi:pyruvate/2-oxoglutarate dehydrogenase complex dihydrolipoamide dehydrogenase (E3) component